MMNQFKSYIYNIGVKNAILHSGLDCMAFAATIKNGCKLASAWNFLTFVYYFATDCRCLCIHAC